MVPGVVFYYPFPLLKYSLYIRSVLSIFMSTYFSKCEVNTGGLDY